MDTRNQARRGNTLIEFTLIGIPTIFVLISIFEIARGMWVYHTLAYAVRDAARYAITHGADRGRQPNVCPATLGEGCRVQDIAFRLGQAGVGLIPDQLMVTLDATCQMTPGGAGPGPSTKGPALLTQHLSDGSVWPAFPQNTRSCYVIVSATYPFQTAIAMFWPGAGKPMNFGTFNLPANAQDRIQF